VEEFEILFVDDDVEILDTVGQYLCGEPFLPGYFDRIYMIFRILIAFFSYPVNPVDPVNVLRSGCCLYRSEDA